ncbi:hypothetical protein FRC10_008249 [Ceratobasidium sp. 414]|nr:hypothetical protein FRC10_008249 [Ceratobasidium sp. 414]
MHQWKERCARGLGDLDDSGDEQQGPEGILPDVPVQKPKKSATKLRNMNYNELLAYTLQNEELGKLSANLSEGGDEEQAHTVSHAPVVQKHKRYSKLRDASDMEERGEGETEPKGKDRVFGNAFKAFYDLGGWKTGNEVEPTQ